MEWLISVRLGGIEPGADSSLVGVMVAPRVRACSRPAPHRAVDQASLTQAQALSTSAASKYWIFAMVNGLQTAAMYLSQLLLPTRATRSIFVQCAVANLTSSHSACRSQPWNSWSCARIRVLPCSAMALSTSGTNVL